MIPPDSDTILPPAATNGQPELDSEGFLRVWTDGACAFNGGEKAVAGVGVWFGPGHPLNWSEQVRDHATNQRAEVLAATKAAQIVRQQWPLVHKLRIFSDSTYLRDCWADWVPIWEANDWTSQRNRPIVNRDLLEAMVGVFRNFEELEIRYVPAHSGEIGNTEADELARQASRAGLEVPETPTPSDTAEFNEDNAVPVERLSVGMGADSPGGSPLRMTVTIASDRVRAMVDSGATRTFVNEATWCRC